MRQSGKNTRQRGRGGRRSNNFGQINRNTTLDSNGPDVRLRGNAQQLHEKYTSLGNESAAAGERISAEAYYQYADHYFRVHSTIIANQEDRRPPQQSDNSAPTNGSDHDSGDDTSPASRDDLSSASDGDDENEAVTPSKSPSQSAGKGNGNGRPRQSATKSEDKAEDLSVKDAEDDAEDIGLPSSLIN